VIHGQQATGESTCQLSIAMKRHDSAPVSFEVHKGDAARRFATLLLA
jgi:hypothetical protein